MLWCTALADLELTNEWAVVGGSASASCVDLVVSVDLQSRSISVAFEAADLYAHLARELDLAPRSWAGGGEPIALAATRDAALDHAAALTRSFLGALVETPS